jgi:hypothetical protein
MATHRLHERRRRDHPDRRDGTHLGQSMYLREVLGREEGTPPPVDLAGVPATRIGTVTGSGLIVMGEASISINKLREAHEGWFPGFMSSATEMA